MNIQEASPKRNITIRMGAAHSDIKIRLRGICSPKGVYTYMDLKKATQRDLWEVGRKLSESLGLKGPTPGVKANCPPEEPLITLPPQRNRKPNGKPHHSKGPAARPKDNHRAGDGPARETLRSAKDGDAPKKPSGRRRKPRTVPASGPTT